MPGRKTKMTDEHKQALAEGRELGRRCATTWKPSSRTSPSGAGSATPDSVKKRLATIESTLPDASPIKKVGAHPGAPRPHVELATMGTKVDLSGLERAS